MKGLDHSVRKANPLQCVCAMLCMAAAGVSQQIVVQLPKPSLIEAGRVLDVAAGRYLSNQGILVVDGKIKQVGPFESVRSAAPPDVTLIDLRNSTVLPGLIDCHQHLFVAADPTIGGADELILTLAKYSPTKRVLLGAEMARELLNAGFTTVRNVGHAGIDGDVSLRDAIRNGWVPGPRVVASGRKITAFRGQILPVDERVLHPLLDNDFLFAATPDEGRDAVRQNLRVGADMIKVIADEWPTTMRTDTMEAIVEEAHRAYARVAVHATSEAGIQAAIDAGADTIEHADAATDKQFQAIREKGIFVDATMFTGDLIVSAQSTTNVPARTALLDHNAYREELMRNQRSWMARARKADVKIAFGTDNWYAFPGRPRGVMNVEDLAGWTTLGVPSAEALRAATLTAADAIGAKDRLGSVEVGKQADLLAVDGDPLASLTDLHHVRLVMKAGAVVSRD